MYGFEDEFEIYISNVVWKVFQLLLETISCELDGFEIRLIPQSDTLL